ncbi:hypothetical protein E2C01_095450 [Portunus trituberculatus]|uniref:Uncharacterized protein n=1 Tax=Portunus trituberculatus TaxID=210409 RepID=A0A5B7K066_PORTR|nr:hypothetical protein [Portunus trituberculatus]
MTEVTLIVNGKIDGHKLSSAGRSRNVSPIRTVTRESKRPASSAPGMSSSPQTHPAHVLLARHCPRSAQRGLLPARRRRSGSQGAAPAFTKRLGSVFASLGI